MPEFKKGTYCFRVGNLKPKPDIVSDGVVKLECYEIVVSYKVRRINTLKKFHFYLFDIYRERGVLIA